MVFKDIERFYEKKEKEQNLKIHLIRDQFIECFFRIHPSNEIKAKIKASLNDSYLPSFNFSYKLRSSSEKVNPKKYIEIIKEENEVDYILVDFDFHNISFENTDFLETSPFYKKFKRELGSDFYFEKRGRTEDGTVEIHFCKVYKPGFLGLF